MSWTPERVSILRHLARLRLTAAEIGVRMDITRNTVIGKARRIGAKLLSGRGYGPRRLMQPPKSKPRPKLKPTKQKLQIFPKGGGEARGVLVNLFDLNLPPDASSFACTITDLRPTSCRWPLGEPSATMLYCGAEQIRGSYCARHYRLAHVRSPNAA